MNYLVFAAIVLLITFLGVYLVIENNRKKAQNAEKKQFNERIAEVTLQFKSKTAEFVAAGAIHGKSSGKINAIVVNYFVVQAHNQENLDHLEKLTEQYILTVGAELNKCRELNTLETLSDVMAQFADELPTNGVAYNKDFYRETLPSLITLIKTPDEAELDAVSDADGSINSDEQSGDDNNNPTQNFASAKI